MRRLPPPPPPPTTEEVLRWWKEDSVYQGERMLSGNRYCNIQNEIIQNEYLKMLLPSAEKIIIYLLYLVLVLMRGSELTEL